MGRGQSTAEQNDLLHKSQYLTYIFCSDFFLPYLIVHRFQVFVAPGTKLESGPATLHFCNDILVLAKDLPPSVMGQWKLSDLRRYGAVPNGFIFEGGTRCGFCKYKWPCLLNVVCNLFVEMQMLILSMWSLWHQLCSFVIQSASCQRFRSSK